MITRAVGQISDYASAQKIIESGGADLIAIGRGYLNDSHWVWRAAIAMKEKIFIPNQYQRGYW